MKNILTAMALALTLPAMAHAQVAAAPKADCCEKMKAAGKDCMAMKDHAKHDMKGGADPHAGHDMSQPASKAAAAPSTHSH